MYQFIVPGAPRGKQRPKVTRNGAYTPEETKQYEQKVLACFLNEYPRMKLPSTGSSRMRKYPEAAFIRILQINRIC